MTWTRRTRQRCYKWSLVPASPVMSDVTRQRCLHRDEIAMPLNDILNCSENELWSVLDSDAAYDDKEPWFFCKGIGMIELCQLGDMLNVDSYDNLMSGFDLVGEPRDEGPWPQTIPSALTTRLATISDDEIADVVPRWATIEEFRGTATVESLADYLTKLRTYLSGRSGDFFLINAL